jgi:hypothetical protein
MVRRSTISMGVLVLLLGGAGVGQTQEESKAKARDSAKEWLTLLDGQEWERTWEQAGELLKAAVSQDEWAKKMSVTLGPLGKVDSRAVRSTEYSTTMPGAPDGEYVVVKMDTSFENKQTATETVVLKKEPDGAWRVSGYFIR